VDDTRKHYENQLSLFGNDRPNAGDNLLDINDRGYGNGQLFTPRPSNATRIAGIIGAVTGNDTGMDGIAENVEMMFLRAVPDGDEFDKDIALAIRYAVDNGAKIIDMGFGKRFSANPEMVEQAMSYAADKGVLIVHGAGDSSSNTDTNKLYPTGTDENGDRLNNYLRVGVSDPEGNVLPTSNYGAQTVDLFAPGVEIYSTVPGDNYLRHKGSSVSAGVVAGVAAMIWSYFPELTVAQLRDILIEGAVTCHGGQTKLPWNQEEEDQGTIVLLSDISRAGGIVNALESVKLAAAVAEKASEAQVADATLEEAVIDSAWLYIFNPIRNSAPHIECYTADRGVSAAFGGFCKMWEGWQSENNDRLIDGLGQMLASAHYDKTSKIWNVTGIVLDRVLSTGDIAQTRAVIAAIDGAGAIATPLKNKRELFVGKEILIARGLD
jgi:subtilisin family serine protease